MIIRNMAGVKKRLGYDPKGRPWVFLTIRSAIPFEDRARATARSEKRGAPNKF